MRDFIGDGIHIDGRMIGYRIATAGDYLSAKGLTEKEIDEFGDNHYEIKKMINQILGLKQSCWLFLRTSHSCQLLSDNLCELKNDLIYELKTKYNYEFDEELVEKYCSFTV